MVNLDNIFGDVLGQVNELATEAKAIVEKRTKWQANVGWEMMDGQYSWFEGKVFDSKEEAQQWVDSLVRSGSFDSGQVEKKFVN